MTREEFFKKFELFAELPDAVPKMRDLVLDLAVSARLTHRIAVDECAENLLERAADERSRLVASKHIKARPSLPITCEDQPFDIPDSWKWTRLSTVGHELGQKVPSSRFIYIDVGSIDSYRGRISEGVAAIEADDAPSRARKRVARGTVIYSTVRPYLRNIAVVDRDFEHEAIASTAFGILHPFAGIESRYLLAWLRSAAFNRYVESAMKGMAYPAINDEAFYNGPIALPPLAEQKRIVAKVGELMALCDQLEAQQKERETRHAALARASVQRFERTPTKSSLTLVLHKSYDVSPQQLRNAIVNAAIQGKVVPQYASDEPAEAILERLRKAGNRGEYQGDTNTTVDLEPIQDGETPFGLPASWAWVRLAEIARIKHGFAFSSEFFTDSPTEFVLTTPGNFHEKGGFRDRGSKTKYYQGPVGDAFIFKAGDLIIPMTEQAPGLLGSPGFIPDDGRTYVHNQRIGKVTFMSDSILPEFAFWFFNCEFFRQSLASTCTGMKVRHTSPTKILRSPYPLCSRSEQRRIVEKISELITQVDRLETDWAQSETTGKKLIEAAMADLTLHC